jgi:hypothetical protein
LDSAFAPSLLSPAQNLLGVMPFVTTSVAKAQVGLAVVIMQPVPMMDGQLLGDLQAVPVAGEKVRVVQERFLAEAADLAVQSHAH